MEQQRASKKCSEAMTETRLFTVDTSTSLWSQWNYLHA